ncbi:hypothetical protein HELRODRAFT_159231 [Helobdella robusta]|uniref:Uncharacterized protein n=1 Tax=Helobdella robusta TaxID=6412 RepID=T1ENS1_HELRO|nr:hypothetical protein HELRODRAFT_159231 [Helobdella robusta]ESO12655.1 hypothetical protein HELRODRAFT_159231 [Helobdella robusta]
MHVTLQIMFALDHAVICCKQHSTFNDISLIQIGASSSATSNTNEPAITKPYFGRLYGLSVNSVRVSDLLVKQDNRTSSFGDIRKVDKYVTSIKPSELNNETSIKLRTSMKTNYLVTTIKTPSPIEEKITKWTKSNLCSRRGGNSGCVGAEPIEYSGFDEVSYSDDMDLFKNLPKSTTPFVRRMDNYRPRTPLLRFTKMNETSVNDLNFQLLAYNPVSTKSTLLGSEETDLPLPAIEDEDQLRSIHFVKKVGVSIGLLIGSVIAVIIVSIFFSTIIIIRKNRNNEELEWKTFEKDPIHVEKNKTDDVETKKTEVKSHTLFHILPASKKINTKEWISYTFYEDRHI